MGFLLALREHPTVLQACESVGVGRRTVYELKEQDADFARDWEDSRSDFADVVLAEFVRRGMEGVERPIYQGGRRVDQGDSREYSDENLRRVVCRFFPEYRDKVEATVTSRQYVVELPAKAATVEEWQARYAPPEARGALWGESADGARTADWRRSESAADPMAGGLRRRAPVLPDVEEDER